MTEKLAERKRREADAIRGHGTADKVSAEQLSARSRGMIKVVKKKDGN
ncbi:MAG TPA: hypothetical protein VMV84_05210 [Dehalococcoidales bacterium]|nr:hypothetical protein [Dehalococcoidales bacterium]